LLPGIPGSGQIGIGAVDSFSAGDLEADDGPSLTRSGVPVPGELGAVEVEVDTAWQSRTSMMGLKLWIGVRDLEAKPLIEGHGGLQVSYDEVHLVKIRAVVHSTVVPPPGAPGD
jgi:hypothetical protein